MRIRNANSGVVVNLPDERAKALVESKAYELVEPANKPVAKKPQRRKRATPKED